MNKRISVLIVDESQTFSMYLALLLQRMGFKSLRVSLPESAKFVLSRNFTDVLIIGDQSGSEPIHAIVQDLAACIPQASIPILVITRQQDPLEQQACLDAGCQAYLLKPVQPKQLHDALYANIAPFPERRRNLRSRVDMIAEVSIDGQRSQPLSLLSLSRGGALIAFDASLPAGTGVVMKLPCAGELISLAGTVTYTMTNLDSRTPRAFGVLFQQINLTHADRIDALLEKMLEADRLVSAEQTDSEEERRTATG